MHNHFTKTLGGPHDIRGVDGLIRADHDKALDAVWALAGYMNKYIDETKPWSLAKTDPEKTKEILLELVFALRYFGAWLAPFMPASAQEISRRLASGKIEKYGPLFPRID